MRTWLATAAFQGRRGVTDFLKSTLALATLLTVGAVSALAQPSGESAGGEASLKLPDLSSVSFLNGAIDGHRLLMIGILFCVFGLGFGMVIFMRLKNLPVHRAMREISELIYETCKTYLITQGRFILFLWVFIAVIITLYFGWLKPVPGKSVALTLPIILLFSLIGIAGSYGVAWFGIRVNTFANSRTAFASLPGKPFPVYRIPLEAGMSIGMMLISVELLIMLIILLFIPGDYAGPCFIGFAIGESLGAAALRIAGGIFTKIADIGSDLMKIVFKIKEDDARNPGVIADCTGDNAGDSVGPSADGFETYGVTGVALITFILLGVKNADVQVQLLVWIFVMRVMMLVSSALSYFLNGAIAKARFGSVDEMNFETPLTTLVWLTSIVSIALTFLVSYFIIPGLGDDASQWWKLASIISCGTLAGALIPELVKSFTSTESRHVKEVVISAEEGGASLGILSGFVAGNFSGYYLGLSMVLLMSIAYYFSTLGLAAAATMLAPAVFAFGLVAFGFLGMGPVTIAVDSYGPVTDNAQSVYELSLIEQKRLQPAGQLRTRQISARSQRRRRQHLQSHCQTRAHRHRRSRSHHHDLLHHHGFNQGPDRGRRQALAVARPVLPRPDHRGRNDLLVHRRIHPGRYHRRLPRCRVHQGQHQARWRGQSLGRR
jgi:K(+)-stimulated pyrophosphate-energized sodium pump